MKTQSNVTTLRRNGAPDIPPQKIGISPGGRRWGYTLQFKMNAVRMVREQGMSVGQVHRQLDIAKTTLEKWLNYYDLKRIPPKGSNEYPVNPQARSLAARDGDTLPAQEAKTSAPPSPAQSPEPPKSPEPPDERKEQIRDAIAFLKQAVDYLFIATRPKQAR